MRSVLATVTVLLSIGASLGMPAPEGDAAPAPDILVPDAERVDDSLIKARLRVALLRSLPDGDRRKVRASVRDGLVTLGGAVGSAESRGRALERASAVRGVRGIYDRIEVREAR